MNTKRSERVLREWNAEPKRLERQELTVIRDLPATPDAIFPLLCPTLEYDWVPGWRCELLHSTSGRAEENAVFRTELRGRREIWVCTRYEPNATIHYARLSKGLLEKLKIDLASIDDRTTRVRWSLTGSALAEEMNPAVRSMTEDPERHRILEHLLDDLTWYLEKGEMRA